jgi:curli production assembly/transport component CsgF
MTTTTTTLFKSAAIAALMFAGQACHAGSLIYTPINPTFGGSPDNGPYLLATANAVNKHQAPATSTPSAFGPQTALEQFNQQLEQAILSRLASSVTSTIVGPNGTLQPGTITTGQFTVNVKDIGSGQLQVTTTDTTTGATTTFQVGQ